MPELPEVETVRRGLLQVLGQHAGLERVVCHRRDLRFPVPDRVLALRDRPITALTRRAKYLLWELDGQSLISHLGMTGSWRLGEVAARAQTAARDQHDHCELVLADGRRLVYRDPRRFGYLDSCATPALARHVWLRDLGPEPLDSHSFHVDWLAACCRGSRAPIKNRIMDQRVVVGVGNIYAAESLHLAGIHPRRAAGRIGRERLERLVVAIRAILEKAITAGGSTIRDFRQAGGSSGYFQHDFQVYGREGLPCRRCGKVLKHAVLAGRATVWCGGCQR